MNETIIVADHDAEQLRHRKRLVDDVRRSVLAGTLRIWNLETWIAVAEQQAQRLYPLSTEMRKEA